MGLARRWAPLVRFWHMDVESGEKCVWRPPLALFPASPHASSHKLGMIQGCRAGEKGERKGEEVPPPPRPQRSTWQRLPLRKPAPRNWGAQEPNTPPVAPVHVPTHAVGPRCGAGGGHGGGGGGGRALPPRGANFSARAAPRCGPFYEAGRPACPPTRATTLGSVHCGGAGDRTGGRGARNRQKQNTARAKGARRAVQRNRRPRRRHTRLPHTRVRAKACNQWQWHRGKRAPSAQSPITTYRRRSPRRCSKS